MNIKRSDQIVHTNEISKASFFFFPQDKCLYQRSTAAMLLELACHESSKSLLWIFLLSPKHFRKHFISLQFSELKQR